MPNELHFYTKYSKEKIKISDKPLASGGEGAIYAIASPRSYKHLVVKVFYPDKRTAEREQKMLHLRKHPPISFEKGQHPSIGWVQDLVYRENRFLGILLLRIEGKKLTKLTLSKLPRRADKAWQRFAFQSSNALKLRLRTCFNLAVVIYQIHESGQYVLVDLKPDNILMQPNGLLAIVDMDSVEVIQDGKALFAAPVATPEYTPPEHYKGPRTVIEETWDRFSLGVIFYQLLLGLHPFAASCHAPYDNLVGIHDKIEHDLYVHHSEKQKFFRVVPPPHRAFEKLPIEIQELFYNCFEEGAKSPDLRPSALDWCSTLAELLNLPFKISDNKLPKLPKLPKIDHPLSKLFFTPEIFVPNLDLNRHYTSTYISIPIFQEKDLASTTKILPEDSSLNSKTLMEFEKMLENAYEFQLKFHRTGVFWGTVLLTFVAILIYYFPVLIIFGLGLIFTISLSLLHKKKENILDAIRETVYPKIDLVDKRGDLLEINRQQEQKYLQLVTQHKQLNAELLEQIQQIQATNHLLEPIRIGLKKQKSIQQEVETFNHWVTQILSPMIKEVRTREINTQKQHFQEFATAFQESNAKIKTWTKEYSKEKQLKKQLKKQEIQVITVKLERLKKTFAHTKETLMQKYEENVKKIQKNSIYQLNITTKKLIKTSNQELEKIEAKIASIEKALSLVDYSNHLHEKSDSSLPYAITNHRINEIINSRPETAEMIQKLFGSNYSACKNHLKLVLNYLPGHYPNIALSEFQTEHDLLLEQIDQSTLGSPEKQRLTQLLQIEYTPLELTKEGNHNSTIQKLGKHKKKISEHYQQIKQTLVLLNIDVIELINTPELTKDSDFFKAKIEKIEIQKQIIQRNITDYNKLQTFFYTERLMFNLYQATQTYALNKGYFFNLPKERQEAKKKIDKKRKKRIKEKIALELEKKALKTTLQKDLLNCNQIALERKETLLADLEQQHQSSLEPLEQMFTKDKEQLSDQLQKAKKNLTDLETNSTLIPESLKESQKAITDHYVQTIQKNQLEFEALYANYKENYNRELDLLKEKFDNYRNSYKNTIQHIQKHKQEYTKSQTYKNAFSHKINTLKKIEAKITTLQEKITDNTIEKIKIDSLKQWEENYQTKIYIKDLLLGQTEQIKLLKEKEKK